MKTQFTPGPWKAINHYICNDNTEVIARVCASNADDLLTCHYNHLANTGVDETAALIASAPEMYAALQSVIEWADNESDIPVERLLMLIRNAARTALQKAKGKL